VVVVLALPALSFLARGLVAGVFLLAGVAKVRDRSSFADVLTGFGVPGAAAPAGAVVLPAAEVAVAVALLVPATSSAGAIGALALLLVFSVAVAVEVVRGRTADCGCFGKDRSGTLSGATLLRNGLLIGLAGALVVVPSGKDAAFGGTPDLAAIGVAALVAVGLLAARRPRRELTDTPSVTVAVSATGEVVESALTRRRWMRVAGVAGLAGALGPWLGWPEVAGAGGCPPKPLMDPSCVCICCGHVKGCCVWCCECSGFAGGGVVQTASGSAQASFFGNKLKPPGSHQQTFGGALVWFDPAWQGTGLLLQSTGITSYRRVPGTEFRELTGVASANGSGKHKFVLRVVDAGKPGSGADTVSLHVSGVAASGAGGTSGEYAADGRLSQGDVTVSLQSTVKVS
jgi:hypothetical protein